MIRFGAPTFAFVRSEIIPYQWKALNDTLKGRVPSHSINNFRIAAEKRQEHSKERCSRIRMWQMAGKRLPIQLKRIRIRSWKDGG